MNEECLSHVKIVYYYERGMPRHILGFFVLLLSVQIIVVPQQILNLKMAAPQLSTSQMPGNQFMGDAVKRLRPYSSENDVSTCVKMR